MNLRELKEIFRLIEKTDFTEVEIAQGELKVRVERGKPQQVMMPTAHLMPHSVPAPHPAESPKAAAIIHAPAAEEVPNSKDIFVTSPFVGTFYRAPSPDADPYAQVGQTVRKGQILCIVEAMKLMNELECDYDGKILDIYPENGQPVEFGEKLFRIEPLG
ncbi:MAG: acetyl-CoA carboxylase biotin carboxyl carrier protein [Pseudomonadota bacterium]